VVLVLFFCSGLSGLIYEVIWTRVLLTIFGATLYAVATVLAAFMGGLALGSLAGGRIADRVDRPLRLYGVLEVLVAVTALAVPFALDLLDPLYRWIYSTGDASFLQLSLIRFCLSFTVLLIPTTCMGATLPLLSRFLVRRGGTFGGRIGGLYAVNTTGAVAGTFVAGFVLIAVMGVGGSMALAAALSAAVGLLSIVASHRLEGAAISPEPESESTASAAATAGDAGHPAWLARLVLITYAISGFAALSFQVLWTRALVFSFDILKNTTYSFSAMLTVFLIGLAAGSGLMSLVVNRQSNPVRLYGLIQVVTGLAGALSLFVLLRAAGGIEIADPLDQAGGFSWGLAVANVFARTAATILLPTLLMGMAFPVAARLCVRHLQAVGAGTGRLYALNTVGAIAGSFTAGFFLIPAFGLSRGLLALGSIYIVLGATVLVVNPAESLARRIAWATLAVAIIGALFIASPGAAPFQDVLPGHRIVTDEQGQPAYIEGPLATVAVIENTIGHRTIYIDNVSVAGTDRILLTDQKSLAHVPALILKDPRSALTVGFGSGGASWSFLQYQEMEQVDCIEICPTVPRLAHTLRDSNHGLLDQWDRRSRLQGQSFHDQRYRVIIDDARSYLRFTDNRYDVIATDCTDLRYKSNANLYDVEYFELCREAITDDGLVVVWMPLGGMSPEVFACAMRTFAHVFPDMTVWYMNNEPTHYLLLLGSKQPLRINIGRILERISRPEIRDDLAEVSLQQPEKILSCFLTEAGAIEETLRQLNPVLNTESTPHLEFESPKFGLGDEPLLTNLEILRQHRRPVQTYLVDADAHPELMQRLQQYIAASDAILAGHAKLRRLQLQEAARDYLAALEICPVDASVQFLLTFDDLRRRVDRYPNDIWSTLTLAEIALLRGELQPASDGFRQVMQLAVQRSDEFARRSYGQAVLGLARCLHQQGRPDLGLRLLYQNAALLQGNSELAALVDELEAELAGTEAG
jgi:spermidine synthase